MEKKSVCMVHVGISLWPKVFKISMELSKPRSFGNLNKKKKWFLLCVCVCKYEIHNKQICLFLIWICSPVIRWFFSLVYFTRARVYCSMLSFFLLFAFTRKKKNCNRILSLEEEKTRRLEINQIQLKNETKINIWRKFSLTFCHVYVCFVQFSAYSATFFLYYVMNAMGVKWTMHTAHHII